MASIEEKVSVVRQAREWTQAELAKELGVSQSTVNRWIRKGAAPEGDNRDKLNELYNEAISRNSEHIDPEPAEIRAFLARISWLNPDNVTVILGAIMNWAPKGATPAQTQPDDQSSPAKRRREPSASRQRS